MQLSLDNNWKARGESVSPQAFRVSVFEREDRRGSPLNRYGFITEDSPPHSVHESTDSTSGTIKTEHASLVLSHQQPLALTLEYGNTGEKLGARVRREQDCIELEFDLTDDELLFGLGDQARTCLQRRGVKALMKVANVTSYIPVPLILSSRGYGLLLNTTRIHGWDLGATDRDKLRIRLPGPTMDAYLFHAPDLKQLLGVYTQLTGRPVLPPKWSFGLWFICRTQANDFEVTSNAQRFRELGLPCDVIGLEPGWQENGLHDYDLSLDKKWDKRRFPIPDYAPNGPNNFINVLKRMGFKLELWLCNDYDLSYEAERRLGQELARPESQAPPHLDDFEQDQHFAHAIHQDRYTRPEEPWFQHLKKFVDQGADMFKQDGAFQLSDHPDRLCGNSMTDEQMHNLYPLLYSRQMFDGFKEHTGRRPCCFTAGGWTGLQRYTGTWTGDTGGDAKTLTACLNLALSGHSLVTCDMEVQTKQGIHYGFLMPWAQVNSWNYWRHPWLQGDELHATFEYYARLRSRLIPYLYTYAHQAHETGVPMMRPLIMEFPDDQQTASIQTQWLLGRELMCSSFTNQLYLPAGLWCDFWTGTTHRGPVTLPYEPPEHRGGALFVRDRSILPLGPLVQYVGQKTTQGFTLHIFLHDQGQAEFELYDDDGITFDYQQGKFQRHRIHAQLEKTQLSITFPIEVKVDNIIAHLTQPPRELLVNDHPQTGVWAPQQQCLNLELTDRSNNQ